MLRDRGPAYDLRRKDNSNGGLNSEHFLTAGKSLKRGALQLADSVRTVSGPAMSRDSDALDMRWENAETVAALQKISQIGGKELTTSWPKEQEGFATNSSGCCQNGGSSTQLIVCVKFIIDKQGASTCLDIILTARVWKGKANPFM